MSPLAGSASAVLLAGFISVAPIVCADAGEAASAATAANRATTRIALLPPAVLLRLRASRKTSSWRARRGHGFAGPRRRADRRRQPGRAVGRVLPRAPRRFAAGGREARRDLDP